MFRFKLIVSTFFCFVTVCLTTGTSMSSVNLIPLPEEGDYKASGVVYKKNGMEPLFDFARSFIHTTLPNELPTDFIKHVMSGQLDMNEVKLQLLQTFFGFVFAIAIGFLFILFSPLIGCCCCCCRLKSSHKFSGAKSHRLILSSALFVVATFALVGNICTYVSNKRMTTGLEEIKSNALNNLDDIDTFLNLTEEQVNVLGPKNLIITQKAVITAMDTTNLSITLSDYIIETLSGGALSTMEANILKADAVFVEVAAAISDLRAIPVPCSFCNALDNDIQARKADFTTFTTSNMNAQIKEQIASKVRGPISNIHLPDASDEFDKMNKQFDKVVTKIRDFRQNTQSGLNIDSGKVLLNEYFDTALKFNNYRWIVGSVLSAILTIVISFLMLGIVFGVLGNNSKSLPVSRGCVSHTGSRMLMVSVVLIFIFSSLLMLLTTPLFMLGALLERYVCQGLDGPNYSLLKVMDDQSFLTNMGITATISDVVRSCKEGKTAYVAFQLENSTTMGFNMKQIQDDIKVNKQAIKQKLETTLLSLTTLDISQTNLNGQLNPLNKLVSSLAGSNFTAMKRDLNSMQTAIGGGNGQILKAIEALDHFEALGHEVGGWRQNMMNSIQNAQTQLSTTPMQQLVTDFSQDVFGIVDRYIAFAFDALENKLGKCTPLWNLYNSLLLVSFCKYTIDPLNGFWFSIGWCIFFFMPGSLLAVILQKYFRRMNTVDVVEDSSSTDSVMELKQKA